MYLLDTNVVSELRRPRPHGAVLAWLRKVRDADLHLSAVTIGEIQAGIEITERVSADVPGSPHSAQYLAVKRNRLGHLSNETTISDGAVHNYNQPVHRVEVSDRNHPLDK